MMQMHKLFFGSGIVSAKDPSISRDILECQIIDEYHWLPQDVAKIPYKKIQKLLLFKRQRTEMTQSKTNIVKAKLSVSGKSKKSYREV